MTHGTPKSTRRQLLLAAGAMAGVGATPAFAQRKKVVIAYGQNPVETTDAFMSSIPLGAGLYQEEGLDVEIVALNGGVTAVNMLASGRAQFTSHSTGGVFAGIEQGVPIKAFICQVPDNFFSIALLPDSPVRSAADLRGKTVGIPSLGGSTVLSLKAVVQRAGMDPNADVKYLPVGGGFPAIDALQRDRVQALFLWDAPYARFDSQGIQLRFFKPDPLPQLGFSFTTNTSLEIIERDPQLVAAMSRALAKSLVFLAAAPIEEIVKLHLRIYPENQSVSRNTADDIRNDAAIARARLGFMRTQQRVFSRTEQIGDETDKRITALRDMLLAGGEIKATHPVDRYFTRQFLGVMNNFDVPALIERAKAFRV